MFLDDFGNPKEVTPETLSTYSYDLHGTKLLTSADTEIYLPPMWHGTIYSTERLLDTYKRRFNPDPTLLTFHAMQPYEPEFICVQRAVVELTLLPAGQSLYSDKDIVVFLIKQPAEMKNSLATKEMSTLLDFFPHNHHYHSIILEEGIDVVYVDDKIYNNISPTSHQFHRLFNLLGNIQPGDVRSLSGTPLPVVLRNACRRTAHKTK